MDGKLYIGAYISAELKEDVVRLCAAYKISETKLINDILQFTVNVHKNPEAYAEALKKNLIKGG